VLLEWMHVYRHDRIELYFEDLGPNVGQKKSNEPRSFVVENSSFRLIDCNKHRRFFPPMMRKKNDLISAQRAFPAQGRTNTNVTC
jgi:hypothetical protein